MWHVVPARRAIRHANSAAAAASGEASTPAMMGFQEDMPASVWGWKLKLGVDM
jgi:hypothetical protein